MKRFISRVKEKENQYENKFLTTKILKIQTEEKTLTQNLTRWGFQESNIYESSNNEFFKVHAGAIGEDQDVFLDFQNSTFNVV
jgi:hypothetical protein